MKNKKQSKIKYFDVWGLRKDKYKFLENHDIKNTKWQELELKEPYYFFVPKDAKGEKVYQKFISVKEIFGNYTSGVETKRDNFVIDFNRHNLENRISTFVRAEGDEDFIRSSFGLSGKSDLNIKKAQDDLKNINIGEDIIDYAYRPFDQRWLFYNDSLVSRPRKHLMLNLRNNNIALNLVRILKAGHKFRHVLISDKPTDRILLSNTTSEASYVFPLYLYNDENKEQQGIFDEKNKGIEQSNFNQNFINLLEKSYSKKFVLDGNVSGGLYAVDIFYYIYGVLYSNKYRQKYNEFLKIDFPKVPFTKDFKLFKQVSDLGKELGSLHLLLGKPKTKAKFSVIGDSRIEKREYNKKEKRVYINKTQYFGNIEPEVWNYYIGGYQVLDKWLKDRIGKVLNGENNDANHYLKIIGAIEGTIKLQKEIDKIYPKIEKSLIK